MGEWPQTSIWNNKSSFFSCCWYCCNVFFFTWNPVQYIPWIVGNALVFPFVNTCDHDRKCVLLLFLKPNLVLPSVAVKKLFWLFLKSIPFPFVFSKQYFGQHYAIINITFSLSAISLLIYQTCWQKCYPADSEVVKKPLYKQKYFSVPHMLPRDSILICWSVTWYIFIVQYQGHTWQKEQIYFSYSCQDAMIL